MQEVEWFEIALYWNGVQQVHDISDDVCIQVVFDEIFSIVLIVFHRIFPIL